MVLHRDGGTDNRLVGFSVIHITVDTVQALLNERKHGGMVVVPIGRHGGGIGLLGGGTLNSDFTTFAVSIFVILTAARNHIPIGTIGDTIGIRIGHVGRRIGSRIADVLRTDKLVPILVGMVGIDRIPRIVHHFSAAVVIGTHGEEVVLGQLHGPLGFQGVSLAVGMVALEIILVVAVQIDPIDVVPTCAVHGAVATVIGAVGVGQGENEKIHIVQDAENARVGARAELVNQAKHEHHAGHFVTVHRGTVKESRLAVGLAVVEAHTQEFASAVERTKVKQGARTVAQGL